MTEGTKTKKQPHSTIPEKEADVISVSYSVAGMWAKKGANWLAWATPQEFLEAVGVFESSYDIRSNTKGKRATITKGLAYINIEIDTGVNYVKGYIAEKFSAKDASSYYSHFGMVKVSGSYRIPRDQNKRERSLKQMISGIEQYELSDRKYGKAYWEDVHSRFETIRKSAIAIDSISAEHVNIKAQKKAYICKVLNSLVYIIKGNYPDSWKDELRVWGFQKEKY
ncbi:MAG: hypothetical protein LBV41_09085 [Cytophagaceae bacterium]|jgi:hypothetical protein|nr:hypothetical protein [Cytophagaceae bacterium]